MEGFIIHLARATARRAQVDQLIEALPFPAQAWPACDGSVPGALDGMRAEEALFQPKFPFALSNGEVACFESHRAIWRHIVDQKLPAAMVFEDDVGIDPDVFARAADLAQRHIAEHGYIQFQTRPVPSDATEITSDGTVKLLRPVVVPLRASAQMISRDAATALLQSAQSIDRPVDVLVQMFWETGVRPVVVSPSGVHDLPGPTTIQGKRGLAEKLNAEIQRPLFRRKMRQLSKKHG
ncbi:GR25 family glycosyltransferase involved in LPS biosynthesis [Litoreibacter ponti]|uniref:GR25 family glycosyltransferase involved in LPS biosynthesis n=1 Tax=Litoreibacter ponti TaxID=1510457 RepID=A0A2T6BPK7_9RHOB|nr:glycosyltransferase family 25 protein [Litoreibacter ponti]PTX58009.1 GR25 family glycosyltransferase involved in LPS biosynthesis [Litoreibacter ponti]